MFYHFSGKITILAVTMNDHSSVRRSSRLRTPILPPLPHSGTGRRQGSTRGRGMNSRQQEGTQDEQAERKSASPGQPGIPLPSERSISPTVASADGSSDSDRMLQSLSGVFSFIN